MDPDGESKVQVDERVEAVAQADRIYPCPECQAILKTPEELGTHLERHAPADVQPATSPRGKPLTAPCPNGCGRHFSAVRGSHELRHHAKVCDGQPPLVGAAALNEETGESPEEDQVAKLKCRECGRTFTHPGWLERHAQLCGGKDDVPSPRAAALAMRLKDARAATAEAAATVTVPKEPLLVVDKDQPALPIRDRVINLLELEEERLAQELGRTKAMLAAVRSAAPEEKGEERPTSEE